MADLRCDNKLHGKIVGPEVVEVACDSRFCGAGQNTVVLHRFNVATGEIISTKRYSNPQTEEEPDVRLASSTSVRTT